MFVEYMDIKEKKEAITFLDASAKVKPAEKDKLYIVKVQEQYRAILRTRKFGKKYSEQKWLLNPCDKGIKAKREMNLAYGLELFITVLGVILGLVFVYLGFCKPDNRMIFLWLSLLYLLVSLFVSWWTIFKPWVSLKIFLIRIL